MAQIFHRSTNTFSRITIYGALFVLAFVTWAFATLDRSGYETRQSQPREQPVPFSHAHHVADCGIDCRYCHTSVETSASADIPPTKTCMNCHSELCRTSPTLAPVRDSFRTGQSISWTRVHDLPDYVYFNHSIHVNKGVGCESCHGSVDKMPLDVAAEFVADGVVPGLPSASRAACAAARSGVHHGLSAYPRPGNLGTQVSGGIQNSRRARAYQLFNVPSMSEPKKLDLPAVRALLETSHGRDYWRSLEDLAQTDAFQDLMHREFPRYASEWEDGESRRNFIKLMGASLALAGLTACTRQPTELINPYIRQPEELVPGRPLFFATAMPLGARSTGLLVESHEGRPTKIEGNPDHPQPGCVRRVFSGIRAWSVRPGSLAGAGAGRRDPFLGRLSRKHPASGQPPKGQAGRGTAHPYRDGHLADAGQPDQGNANGISRRKMASMGARCGAFCGGWRAVGIWAARQHHLRSACRGRNRIARCGFPLFGSRQPGVRPSVRGAQARARRLKPT